MKSVLKIRSWLIVGIFSLILSWLFYVFFLNTNIEKEQKHFQKTFSELESKQTSFKATLKQVIKSSSNETLWSLKDLRNNDFIVHLYKNDSLIYWNSNQIEIAPDNNKQNQLYVDKLSNGFYLINQFEIYDLQVCISAKIKNDYYYQNSVLQNEMVANFNPYASLEISFEKNEDNYPVVSNSGKELFYIQVLKNKTVGISGQLTVFGFFVFGILSLFVSLTYLIYHFAEKKWGIALAYPLFLLISFYFLITDIALPLFSDFEIYSPTLYVNSSYIPNMGSLILSLTAVFLIIWWCLLFLKKVDGLKTFGAAILITAYILLLIYSGFISHTLESFILNSSISLEIDEFFSVSAYSVIAMLLIAFLFFSYYVIVRQLSVKLVRSKISLSNLALIWFFSSFAFFVFQFWYAERNVFSVLWPLFINALIFYLATKERRLNELRYHIIIVIVISFYGSLILSENNLINEHLKRELYANQLITDQDPALEFEFEEVMSNLENNSEFYQLLDNVDYFSAPNFALQIEDCCFGDFWEHYEMNFFFFNQDGSPLMEFLHNQSKPKEDYLKIIQDHTIPSTIADGLFYVDDYFDQISYISHKIITTPKQKKIDFFILFKSKKIPEKIGFPRLLMNEKSYALKDLETYSIARYSNGNLVMRFGGYNYPTTIDFFDDNFKNKSGFISINKINHLIYRQNDNQIVVISLPEKQFIEQLSLFSYLVLFFGTFALICLLIFKRHKIFPLRSLQLSLKVQIVLIGMIVIAFFVFIFIAVENVTTQYKINTQDSLKEKIYSIETVVGHRLNDKEKLVGSIHADYLSFTLKRLSNVFVADINFFTPNGKLFATSQSKIYDKGISSRLMNNQAFFSMKFDKRSEFIHTEKYGELSFLSGYIPFKNQNDKLLGYINLQHFTKQNIFERQMNEFVVASVNVAVLLLVISVLFAIVISGWITFPLRLIQQSFSKVELDKENQPIHYHANDEIGALVKEYNNKLAELELKAMQLAQSERETAWREMAKQVAHEIKNPLTPMKLSIQHFQRSFDPNDPDTKEKIQRIAASLIEQIDTLTNIANEFSDFAKMPKSNEENLNLLLLLQKVADLYSSQDIDINLQNKATQEIVVFADKNLLLRAFNNLIKNAIQATKENEKTQIIISIEEKYKSYLISVTDNGTGIPQEIREKMFVPNFTTKTTGSGLGLAMVKQIITTHNGNIWFESEIGKGTVFYIELPKK